MNPYLITSIATVIAFGILFLVSSRSALTAVLLSLVCAACIARLCWMAGVEYGQTKVVISNSFNR